MGFSAEIKNRARFSIALLATLSIVLGSFFASSPVAHAWIHGATTVAHDHDSEHPGNEGAEPEDTEGAHVCFICEIVHGHLTVDGISDAPLTVAPGRPEWIPSPNFFALASLDRRLPPILGPPAA